TSNSKGSEIREFIDKINSEFLPNAVIILNTLDNDDLQKILPYLKEYKTIEGQPAIYICQNFKCESPLTDLNEALNRLIK
ncbi:MAG: hypothetical protein PHV06_10210, partial [bacterium]|nr:hypothetical protein [bacterium]